MLSVVILSVMAPSLAGHCKIKRAKLNTVDVSCRILEHFATKPDPVTQFIKLRSTIIFKHFATNWIQ
jgi:hypothetical protein